MRQPLISLLLGVGLGLAGLETTPAPAIAQKPSQPQRYNCLTREVWTPAKQAWCNQQAQTAQPTILTLETNQYAVRIWRKQGQPVINLYNRKRQRLELSAAPVTTKSDAQGTAYRYQGKPTVRVLAAKSGVKLLEVNGVTQSEAMTAKSATVTGSVTYRQRSALPANAIISVSLLDVSRQDVAAEVLASETIKTDGRQVPIPFTLTYDPDRIQPTNTYSVRARILVGEQLLFTSTSAYQVITQGRPSNIEVWVEPVK